MPNNDDPIIPPADKNFNIPVPDLVWAMRNWLMHHYGAKTAPKAKARLETEAGGEAEDSALQLTSRLGEVSVQRKLSSEVYPYTKGPDYANDLLGYGERLREVSRFVGDGDTLIEKTRISRRTRSGRTPENATESPTKSLDSVRPSQPPPSGGAVAMTSLRRSEKLPSMNDYDTAEAAAAEDASTPSGESGGV